MTSTRPPSDLEHACAGYRQGLHLLATHPGPLAERLRAAALSHLVDAGPWTRPRLPQDVPTFMRPEHDMPGTVLERLRVVASDLTQEQMASSTRAAELAEEVVRLEADLRALLADRRRRFVTNLGMAVTNEEFRRPPSDEELIRSDAWSEEHLVILGRIIEVSASNEQTGRRLLGRAMGVPESNFGNRQYVDAVFLGSRLNDLSKRLAGLSQMEGLPEWLPVAAAWMRRAAAADERRNQLLHRPPVLVMGGRTAMPGMSAARRNQTTEVINTQALDLLRELDSVWRASFDVLTTSTATE